MKCALGLDFGTGSARAVVVSLSDGREMGSCAVDYPHGVLLDSGDPDLARQDPSDHLLCLRESAGAALPVLESAEIVGIGVAATASSPLPVDAQNRPLSLAFEGNLDAKCWLWKDHTSIEEAEHITTVAQRMRPQYLAQVGGAYSAEWYWAKILHCLRLAPDVFKAAHSWVELADWTPAVLSGVVDPVRGVCAAGHKALYSDRWGGLPDRDFLNALDPRLPRPYERALPPGSLAGHLCTEWASNLGLREGIPIAVGMIDVHAGAIGCGISEGTMVKVIGTSSCDLAVVAADEPPHVPGISGVVFESILPGLYGLEAGQSAVGDVFGWWAERVVGRAHDSLAAEAARLAPGECGLLALDWNNGNRNVLADPRLSGLLIGQTLATTPAHVYRALIEATAFGARVILERMVASGVRIDKIVCAGGIAERSPFAMQIYADVLGTEMAVSSSSQTCALGAAICGAVAAKQGDFADLQSNMTGMSEKSYRVGPEASKTYDELFELYAGMHNAFGGVSQGDLSGVMARLREIKNR